jgi:predicted acyltransferase (DUF342 family)
VRGNVAALPISRARWWFPSTRASTARSGRHIVVNGTINGPVAARETLELQANSRVKGDIHYKSIEIQQGAVIEGRLVHLAAEVKGVELKVAK